MNSLTIAIPTYHRTRELLRLLSLIKSQLNRLQPVGLVDVLVRDNSDNDETKNEIAHSEFAVESWLDYSKNEGNVGFDRNMLNLFCEAKGDYVWFIGDDDIIFEGSIQKVLELIAENADIVHLPFRQPQNLEYPQYQRSPRIQYWMETSAAVEQILKYIKITSFVLRRNSLALDQKKLSEAFGVSGWMHLILCFEVLLNSARVKTMTLSEFFAGSLDAEWKKVNWTPDSALLAKKLSEHDICKKFDLRRVIGKFERGMYLGGIQMTLLVTSGKMSTEHPAQYTDFGAAYPFMLFLLWKPIWLIKYLIIKLRAGASFKGLITSYERFKTPT